MRLDTVEGAILFATQAHDGQLDKAGAPYILHPLRVGASLHDYGTVYVIAGILHDVIEDTPHTLDDLTELGADPVVVAAVASVTKDESERGWDAYKRSLQKAIQHPVGGWVKAADVADNWSRLDHETLGSQTYRRLFDKYLKARVFLAEAGFHTSLFERKQ